MTFDEYFTRKYKDDYSYTIAYTEQRAAWDTAIEEMVNIVEGYWDGSDDHYERIVRAINRIKS